MASNSTDPSTKGYLDKNKVKFELKTVWKYSLDDDEYQAGYDEEDDEQTIEEEEQFGDDDEQNELDDLEAVIPTIAYLNHTILV